MNFQAGFAPITELPIPVAMPRAIQMDFAGIDYRRKLATWNSFFVWPIRWKAKFLPRKPQGLNS
ncbi:MAG: hypothetical protein ACREPQ_16865 [Rhodanobacter sp.]